MPHPVNGKLSQGFGPTNEELDSAYNGYAHFNKGYDYSVPAGTPVSAVVGGRVIAAGPGNEGWGTRVWVVDDRGYIHNYGHLAAANVRVGDNVKPGQVIATSGNSGKSTGPHLSYDVWMPGPKGNEYVDPGQFINGGSSMPNPSTNPYGTNGGVGGTGAVANPNAGGRSSAAQNAATIRSILQTYAAQNNLPPEFVHAALAIPAQESGFLSEAHNDGTTMGTHEDSYGPWQINRLAHPDVSIQQAQDPIASTLQRLPDLTRAWNSSGGLKAFQADPTGFQQKFHSTAQGSVVPTPEQANDALNIAYQLQQGTVPQTLGPYQADNLGGAGQHTPAMNLQPAQPPALDISDPRVMQQAIAAKVSQALQSGDPTQIANATQLMSIASQMQDLNGGTVSADTLAQLGFSKEQLEFERQKFNQTQAAQASQFQDSQQTTRWAQTGDWAQQEADRQARYQEIANTYQLGQGQLEVARQRLGLDTQLGFGQLGLAATTQQQTNALGRDRLAFDQTNAAEQNQMGRDRLGFDIADSGSKLQLGQQQGLQQERQSQLASIVDLVGKQVDLGAISQRQAEAALNALSEQFNNHPTQSEYPAGFEPGGLYSFLQGQITGNPGSYDASQYKMRQFPLDLAAIARADGKMDFGDAWTKAKELLTNNGMMESVFKPLTLPGTSATLAGGEVSGSTAPTFDSATGSPGSRMKDASGDADLNKIIQDAIASMGIKFPGAAGQPGAAPTGMPVAGAPTSPATAAPPPLVTGATPSPGTGATGPNPLQATSQTPGSPGVVNAGKAAQAGSTPAAVAAKGSAAAPASPPNEAGGFPQTAAPLPMGPPSPIQGPPSNIQGPPVPAGFQPQSSQLSTPGNPQSTSDANINNSSFGQGRPPQAPPGFKMVWNGSAWSAVRG